MDCNLSNPLAFVCSDVTAACEAARGLASSVAVSADEANAAAKPAFDKIVEIMVRASLFMCGAILLRWTSSSKKEERNLRLQKNIPKTTIQK